MNVVRQDVPFDINSVNNGYQEWWQMYCHISLGD